MFVTQLTVSDGAFAFRDGINAEAVPQRDGIRGVEYRMSDVDHYGRSAIPNDCRERSDTWA
jgi:hypothetical protein